MCRQFELFFLSATIALASGCCKEEAAQEPASAAKPADVQSEKPVAKAEKPEAPPIDARLKPHFEAGQDCKWNEYGLATCAAASAVRNVAFQNQSDSKLAAGCAGALAHEDALVRGLAAECMGGFNDSTRIPHLAAGLDAIEAERSPELRAAIARAFSNGNARESGVEDRVIGMVRKLADEPAGAISASYIIDSMFPSYLMQATQPPSKAAGDLAMEMARREDRLGQRALAALGQLRDRGPEACAVLIEIAKGDDWAPAVESISMLKDACAAGIDPVVDQVASQLKGGRFNVSEYSATRQLLKRVPLTKAHIKRLRGASRVRAKKERKSAFAKDANELVSALKAYSPPK